MTPSNRRVFTRGVVQPLTCTAFCHLELSELSQGALGLPSDLPDSQTLRGLLGYIDVRKGWFAHPIHAAMPVIVHEASRSVGYDQTYGTAGYAVEPLLTQRSSPGPEVRRQGAWLPSEPLQVDSRHAGQQPGYVAQTVAGESCLVFFPIKDRLEPGTVVRTARSGRIVRKFCISGSVVR